MLTSCLPYLGTKLQAVILTDILMALQVVSIWLRFCLILTLRYAIMSINIYWYSYHHTENNLSIHGERRAPRALSKFLTIHKQKNEKILCNRFCHAYGWHSDDISTAKSG